MNNRFKSELSDEGEVEQEVLSEPKAELPRNFFTTLFTEGVVSKQAATQMLPFIIFVAFLAMVYIGNQNFAVKNVRDIDRLSKEVKELSWDFKSLKAELMRKSTQTEVAAQVDTLGLMVSVEPPKKIVVKKIEN